MNFLNPVRRVALRSRQAGPDAVTRRVASGPHGNGRCISREKSTFPAGMPDGQEFNPRSAERGQRRMLRWFGVIEARSVGNSRFKNNVSDRRKDGPNYRDQGRARQLTAAAVVAPQAAGVMTACVVCVRAAGRRFSSGHVTRVTVMMMLRMIDCPVMARPRRHAVLAKRHCHGCVSLQREPQDHQHGQKRSPADHERSVCHNDWLY